MFHIQKVSIKTSLNVYGRASTVKDAEKLSSSQIFCVQELVPTIWMIKIEIQLLDGKAFI